MLIPSNETQTTPTPYARTASGTQEFVGFGTGVPIVNALLSETIGTKEDVIRRLLATLPGSWFPSEDSDRPVLNALLEGLANPSAHNYALLAGLVDQLRIGSATGPYLDLIFYDLFGNELPRAENEADAGYRERGIYRLFRLKNTFRAVDEAFELLVGYDTVAPGAPRWSVSEFHTPSIADQSNFVQVSGTPCLQFAAGSSALTTTISTNAQTATPYNSIVYLQLPQTVNPTASAGYRPLSASLSPSREGRYISLSDWTTNGPPSGGTAYTTAGSAGKSRYYDAASLIQQIVEDDMLKFIEDVRPAGCTLWVVLEI